jgi:hypothetical protein
MIVLSCLIMELMMKEFSYVVLHQRNFDFTTLEEIEPANIRNKIRRSQAFCLQRIFHRYNKHDR